MKTRDSILIILGILFISFNLRAPITAVGSLINMIKSEFPMSNAMAGFITTLPLIAFAVVSPLVARITHRIGHFKTMMAGLVLIVLGLVVRSYAGMIGLFVGTAVIGIAIAVGNVIVPAIIKSHFAHKVGVVTSIYTTGMCVFAAVGAGVSMPLAKDIDLGWHHSLAAWLVLAVATIIIWAPHMVKTHTPGKKRKKGERKSVWTSKLGWWVTLFMGVQSLIFYSLVAWLPTIILSKDLSEGFAGTMALTFQLMAIPATLVIPALCDKFDHQKHLVMVVCGIYAAGMLGLMFGMTPAVLTASIIAMAIGMGGSISLSIAFISLRSPTAEHAAELSGMAQSAGYLFAALGPILTGLLFDELADWTLALGLFTGLIVFLAFCGMFAGADRTLEH